MHFKSSFLKKFYLFLIVSILNSINLFCCSENKFSELDTKYSFNSIISDVYNQLGFSNFSNQDLCQTQTISYLSRLELRQSLAEEFNSEINRIGADFFKDLFRRVLDREVKFKRDYFVFYHGQQRMFKMVYDLSRSLFEIVCKKTLRDFIFMRFPGDDFSKFNSVQEFLKKYIENGKINRCDFDHIPKISSRLLALNPCLFGNSRYLGECSFYYFIVSSNASGVDFGRLIYKMLQSFDLQDFYEEQELVINEMLNLLSEYEVGQTGVLVQIFIPRRLVNDTVYRCRPWGLLYHEDDPQAHPADQDLNAYENGSFNEQFKLDYEFDSVQFRALMNQNMLDPAKGVKYFCYYKETENIKKYETLFHKFVKELSSFVGSKGINNNMFYWSNTENS